MTTNPSSLSGLSLPAAFGVALTDAHYERLANAMAADVSRLTPEMVGEEAMELGALLLFVMDQLNERTGLCGHIVLSLVQEYLWAHACDWSKATFDLVDGADLRAIRQRYEEDRAMRARRNAYALMVSGELAGRKAA